MMISFQETNGRSRPDVPGQEPDCQINSQPSPESPAHYMMAAKPNRDRFQL
ncbi:hypothetical protein HY29_00740 [Hyphomonas beringensis]|uniref:Uncharacterized protein n=1 Tax=Hyphomonas beringensis TaxID=1280946 RepID=A0A062UL38_9PROT|nr:hypothetical protein HY29_00740 [Hyphomonas beringensis]